MAADEGQNQGRRPAPTQTPVGMRGQGGDRFLRWMVVIAGIVVPAQVIVLVVAFALMRNTEEKGGRLPSEKAETSVRRTEEVAGTARDIGGGSSGVTGALEGAARDVRREAEGHLAGPPSQVEEPIEGVPEDGEAVRVVADSAGPDEQTEQPDSAESEPAAKYVGLLTRICADKKCESTC